MRLVSLVLAGALALGLTVTPQPAVGQGLRVSGYADLEFSVEGIGSGDEEIFFDNHHFNLIFFGDLVKNVFAAAEVEYEHAGEEIALEYGYIAYTGIKNFRIMGGKFIVPFGRFNRDLHPTWINKIPGRPHGFRNILPQTYSDVGIWVSGGAAVGQGGARVVYDAWVVNGLMGDDGGDIRGMRNNYVDELSAGGHDNQKSFGGRLGVELGPQGVDIGVSAYAGNYLDDPATNLTLAMYGVDAAWHYRGLELRAEGVLADQAATGGDLTKKGGYAQATYLIQGKFEPAARYSIRDMPGEADDASRLALGASYYVSANSSVRAAYYLNWEKAGFEVENNNIVVQWNLSF